MSKFYSTVQHQYLSLALCSLFYSSQAFFKSFIDPSSQFVWLDFIMEVSNWFSRFQSPCLKLPCQNDGTCIPLYRTNSYKCRCTKAYTGSHCEKGKGLVSRTMFLKIFRARACRIWSLLSHHSSSSDFILTCLYKHEFFSHYYSFSLFFLHQLIMTAAVHQDQKENKDAK